MTRSTQTIVVHLQAVDGGATQLRAEPGQSLMRAALAAGVAGIAADCGGVLSCATCHVIVAADWAPRLPPPAADEAAMLEMTAAAREATSRLACQILLQPTLDGLRVRLPDRQY
jgi:2Fe-2S ferredoxin